MKHIAMIASVRSGTTMLRMIMNSHKDVCGWPEIFLRSNLGLNFTIFEHIAEEDTIEYMRDIKNLDNKYKIYRENMDEVSAGYKVGSKVTVVDVKYGQIVPHRSCDWSGAEYVIDSILSSDCKILHLKRRNAVALEMASRLAELNPYTNYKEPYSVRKITLEPNEFYEAVEFNHRQTEKISGIICKSSDNIEIAYEDIIDERGLFSEKMAKKLSEFFCIDDQFDRNVPTKKASPCPKEAIANYLDVYQRFKGTKFEHMI